MKVEKPRHLTTTPDPPHISSSSCVGRCLYNIPQGTLIILMPGTVILLIGSFMTSLTSVDSSYDDHLVYMSVLFLALGAIVTVVGIVFWCVVWTRGKPPPSPPKYRPSSTESVQLVGVYKISDGHVNSAHTDDSGHVSRAFNGDSGHGSREDTIEPDNINRTRTEKTYQVVGSARADDSGHASAASDASRTPADSGSCHVDIEHHGHVNRAHTDDDGNAKPELAASDASRTPADSSSCNVDMEHHGHVNRAHTDDDGNAKPEVSDDNGDIVDHEGRRDDDCGTADVSHSNNDITATV